MTTETKSPGMRAWIKCCKMLNARHLHFTDSEFATIIERETDCVALAEENKHHKEFGDRVILEKEELIFKLAKANIQRDELAKALKVAREFIDFNTAKEGATEIIEAITAALANYETTRLVR